MHTVFLRTFEDGDIFLVKEWLAKEHVKKWFEYPEEWLREIKKRYGEFSFLHHKIVSCGAVPVGFCQYYDCFYADEDWYTKPIMPGKLFSIDYMIGNETYLRKGFGKRIIQMLTAEISGIPGAQLVIVRPDTANIASIKALLSAGYTYDTEKDRYSFELE